MDPNLYSDKNVHETHEKKFYRLKNKWLVESNIWIVGTLIVEWA